MFCFGRFELKTAKIFIFNFIPNFKSVSYMSRLTEKINKNKMQSDTHPLNCLFDLTEESVCLSKVPNLHHRRLIKVASSIVRSCGTCTVAF